MTYLVMECGLSYAVVLDSEGRFLTVPNLGYQVGQTLEQVELPAPCRTRRRGLPRWAAAAACVGLVLLGSWQVWRTPVGTVRMQINPDVRMSVNRFERVVALEGLNADGRTLIEGCRTYGRAAGAVSDLLADRAVELGYLESGGTITLTVDAARESWRTALEEQLLQGLDAHLEEVQVVARAPGLDEDDDWDDENEREEDIDREDKGDDPLDEDLDDPDDVQEDDDRDAQGDNLGDDRDDDRDDGQDDDLGDDRDDDLEEVSAGLPDSGEEPAWDRDGEDEEDTGDRRDEDTGDEDGAHDGDTEEDEEPEDT